MVQPPGVSFSEGVVSRYNALSASRQSRRSEIRGLVVPDPPLTPTLEEMNAAFGDAQIITGPGLLRRYQYPLCAAIPLIETLHRSLDHPEIFSTVTASYAGWLD